ncbi:MAG: enoyl-CoA hydratase-related protein, partial [Rubrivivax sp.]|nr:enoyl-CoA hydratase-related protein [Rubrivivax sp.]
MNQEALVLHEKDARGVVTLTLNRPQAFNSLSEGMIEALQTTLHHVADDPAARVVVIAAAGKAFCAGHDLKEMQAARTAPDKGASFYADLFAQCARVMQMIPALPQPVIARVHGLATAAGCQLAASCDMVTAADTARFGVNGVNIGLFCSTPMVALTRK